jgi:cellulose synthase operon protein C
MRPFGIKTHKFSLILIALIACLVFLTGCPPSSKTAKENLAQTESEAERDAAIQKQIDDYDRQMEKLASDRESIVKPYMEKRTKQREDAITEFVSFLQAYPNSDYAADVMLRLGELYRERDAERADTLRAEASKLASEHPEEEVESSYTPQNIYKDVVDTYQKVIFKAPDHPNLDIAYYGLANALAEGGDTNAAREALETLVERFPNSTFADDSYYHIGDLYFYEDKYQDAIKFYQSVNKDSKIYSRALLKQGWSYFNLANDYSADGMSYYPKAVDCFIQLLDDYTSKQDEDSRIRFMANIIVEWATSLKDANGAAGNGVELTRRVLQESAATKGQAEKPYAAKMFDFLGNSYVGDGHDDRAIEAYTEVLDRYPQYPGSAKVIKSISICYIRQKNIPAAMAQLERLLDNYGPESSWAKAVMTDQEDLFNLYLIYKQALADVANYYCGIYEKSKSNEDAEKAVNRYRQYLNTFPFDKDCYKFNYLLAQTLSDLKRFDESAVEYLNTAYGYQDVKKFETDRTEGVTQANAGHNAVLSYNDIVKNDLPKEAPARKSKLFLEEPKEEVAPTPSTEGTTPAPETPPAEETLAKEMPLEVKFLVDACDRFSSTFPNDPRVPQVLDTEGSCYFLYGHYDEARSAYAKVMDMYENKALIASMNDEDRALFNQCVMNAVSNTATSYYNEDNQSEAEKWYAKAETYADITKTDVKQKEAFRAQREKASFQEAAKNPDELARAKAHEENASKYPGTKTGRESLNEAFKIYYRQQSWPDVARVSIAFVDGYPDDVGAPAALVAAGKAYALMNQPDRAVDCFKRFMDNPKYAQDKVLLSDATYNIGLAYEKLQDWDKVASTFKNYRLNLAGDWVRVTDACMREGNADMQLGRRDDAKAAYTLCATAFTKIDPNQITLYDTDKVLEPEQQEARKKELLTLAKNSAAKASIFAADLFYDAYVAVKLTPESALAGKFKEKKSHMDEVKALLDQAITYNEPSTVVQAHYRLGKMYQEMAESIVNADRPRNYEEYLPVFKVLYNLQVAVAFNLTSLTDLSIQEYATAVQLAKQNLETITDETQYKSAEEFARKAAEEGGQFAYTTGAMFISWANDLMLNIGDVPPEGVKMGGGRVLDADGIMAMGDQFDQVGKNYYEQVLAMAKLVDPPIDNEYTRKAFNEVMRINPTAHMLAADSFEQPITSGSDWQVTAEAPPEGWDSSTKVDDSLFTSVSSGTLTPKNSAKLGAMPAGSTSQMMWGQPDATQLSFRKIVSFSQQPTNYRFYISGYCDWAIKVNGTNVASGIAKEFPAVKEVTVSSSEFNLGDNVISIIATPKSKKEGMIIFDARPVDESGAEIKPVETTTEGGTEGTTTEGGTEGTTTEGDGTSTEGTTTEGGTEGTTTEGTTTEGGTEGTTTEGTTTEGGTEGTTTEGEGTSTEGTSTETPGDSSTGGSTETPSDTTGDTELPPDSTSSGDSTAPGE